MKTPKAALLLLLLASLFATSAPGGDTIAPPAVGDTDKLTFANGDVLHGTFLGYDKTGVHWQSPDSKDPSLFQTANLREVNLHSHESPGNAPAQSLLLANGDELTGTVVSLDDTTLLLDTWYAGRLAIPRKMLKGIVSLQERKTILYQGPTGVDGWSGVLPIGEEPRKGRGGTWAYCDGTFIASGHGSLMRQLKLPASGCIEFDLDMPGTRSQETDDYYHFDMWVFADNTSYIPSITKLNGKDSIILQHHHPGQPATTKLGKEWDLPGSGERLRDKIHFEFLFENETNSIWIVINGSETRKWVDKDGTVPATATLSLITDDRPSVSNTKISNIKISEWNGLFDSPFDTTIGKPREDIIVDDKQNSISGAVKSITGGKVTMDSSYGRTVIPLEHLRQITLARGDARPEAGGVDAPAGIHAYFPSRGNVTMEIESWDAKQITVSSPDFGKAVFSRDAFQALRFHSGSSVDPKN